VPGAELELVACDVSDFHPPPRSFDLVLCVGSTQPFGGLRGTLRALDRLVVPGGRALIGEGYWRRAPDPKYLGFLGTSATALASHVGTQRQCAEAGWEVLAAFEATDLEWDTYEEHTLDAIERHGREHPGDPDAAAMLKKIRAWHHAYQFYGRQDLGFGLYLVRRPP
jgi:SAM-dependent methyltransferase